MRPVLLTIMLVSMSGSLAFAQDPCERLYRVGQTQRAIACFDEALGRSPESHHLRISLVRSWNDRATELAGDGHMARALKVASTARALAEQLTREAPGNAEAWLYLSAATGNMALFSGNREKVRIGHQVERYSRMAIQLDSSYALPHVVLGMYYREVAMLGRVQRGLARLIYGSLPDRSHERALSHLRKAVELAPQLRVAHYQLAKTLDMFGQESEAAVWYVAALKAPPVNSRDLRNADEAEQRLETLAASSPRE